MRTWTSPGVCLVAGALASTSACEPIDGELQSSSGAPLSRIAAAGNPDAAVPGHCAKFVFPPPDPPGVGAITCPRDVCGVNGIWFGEEVPFRTLNLDRTPNESGLAIDRFMSADLEPLELDVVGDSLIGRKPTGDVLTGPALRNAKLTLVRHDPSGTRSISLTVYVHIIDVLYLDFAATCTSSPGCSPQQTPVYRFTATTGEGCNVQLCKPGINPPDNGRPELAGDAVLFEGDLYNEDTFEVTIAPRMYNQRGTFNLTCLGTTLSKMHLLRHTSASQSPSVASMDQPQEAEREALLRMFTADYCGRGGLPLDPADPDSSSLFTRNGVPIRIAFSGAAYQPTYASGFHGPHLSLRASTTAAPASTAAGSYRPTSTCTRARAIWLWVRAIGATSSPGGGGTSELTTAGLEHDDGSALDCIDCTARGSSLRVDGRALPTSSRISVSASLPRWRQIVRRSDILLVSPWRRSMHAARSATSHSRV